MNFLLKKGWIKGDSGTYILGVLYQVFEKTSLSKRAEKSRNIDICDPNDRNSEID